jgi:hypothetical protein
MYFRQPISDRDEVRAVVARADREVRDAQLEARVERPDGAVIAAGTASIGQPAAPSALRAQRLDEHPAGEVRILAGLAAGDVVAPSEVTVAPAAVDARIAFIEEPLAWYSEPSPWGGRLLPMTNLMGAMQLRLAVAGRAVGLFGAIELAHVDGPALVGRTYRKGGTIRHVGTSPKTEYVWYDAWLDDGDRRVAEMRFMLRFMKASSPLWA